MTRNRTLHPIPGRSDGEFQGKYGPINLRALEDWNRKNTLAKLAYRYLPLEIYTVEEQTKLKLP